MKITPHTRLTHGELWRRYNQSSVLEVTASRLSAAVEAMASAEQVIAVQIENHASSSLPVGFLEGDDNG